MLNLLYLIVAITFELCGDASLRVAIRSSKWWLFPLGIILLAAYGTLVSFPNWSFSKTMGVYIAIFFIISQLVAVSLLGEKIHLPTLLGGALIVAGGLVILLWSPA